MDMVKRINVYGSKEASDGPFPADLALAVVD